MTKHDEAVEAAHAHHEWLRQHRRTWLVEWPELPDEMRDERVEAMRFALASLSNHDEAVEALSGHWLYEMRCDHETKTDQAFCSCGLWSSAPQPSIGEAAKRWAEHALATASLSTARGEPIPMVLYCPRCGLQHIDDAVWTNTPHRSHLCNDCGLIWRPADVATTGVASIETRGKADTSTARGEAVKPVVENARAAAYMAEGLTRAERERAMQRAEATPAPGEHAALIADVWRRTRYHAYAPMDAHEYDWEAAWPIELENIRPYFAEIVETTIHLADALEGKPGGRVKESAEMAEAAGWPDVMYDDALEGKPGGESAWGQVDDRV